MHQGQFEGLRVADVVRKEGRRVGLGDDRAELRVVASHDEDTTEPNAAQEMDNFMQFVASHHADFIHDKQRSVCDAARGKCLLDHTRVRVSGRACNRSGRCEEGPTRARAGGTQKKSAQLG